MFGDLFDLQRHETLINCGHVIVSRGAPEHLFIALGDLRLITQGADVVPLAHAHRPASLFDGDLYIEFGKGFDKNLGRGERAEIDHGAGPVENGGLQLAWVGVVHVRESCKSGRCRAK